MTIKTEIHTADDLWRLSHLPQYSETRLELSEGQVIEMASAGGLHGLIAMRLGYFISDFVAQHNLGYVTAAETGYVLFTNANGKDTVRAPDVGYIAKARLPDGMPDGYIPLPPDLAVEVISPNDEAYTIQSKLDNYLKSGVQLIWLCYPKQQTVNVYSNQSHIILRRGETLSGGSVLPGFQQSLARIFD